MEIQRPPGSVSQGYLPQLDGLRAMAVCMVFVHHALAIPLLWAGVDLFFILSGYLITGILLRDRERLSFRSMLGQFYLRRAERILPAYVLFLLVAWWFVRDEWPHLWGYYVFFLQNVPFAFHPDRFTILVPLWSLAIEQHFYLVWPVLIFLLPRSWLMPGLLVLLAGTPILRALCTPLFPTSTTIYALTPFRLDTMAAGALAALLLPGCNRLRAIRWGQIAMVAGTFAYAALAYHHPWFNRTANTAAFNGLAYTLNIAILGGLFVWVVLAEGGWLVGLLSYRWVRGLGRISYCFYLFHLLILTVLQPHMSRYAAAGVGFVSTVAIAAASWRWLEKPILSLSASHRQIASASVTRKA